MTLSAGFVGIMTAKVDKLAKNAQVSELHQEMKQSMTELVGVTEEIRAGFNPLEVGRKILQEEGAAAANHKSSSFPGRAGMGDAGFVGATTRGTAATRGAEAAAAPPPPRIQVTPVGTSNGGGGGFGMGFAAGGASSKGGGSSGGTHLSSAEMGVAAAAAARVAPRVSVTSVPSTPATEVSGGSYGAPAPGAPSHLPFSAVSVGRARLRPEITGGADIILDGIVEAEVAARAMALMQSGELDRQVAQQQERAKARGDTVVTE